MKVPLLGMRAEETHVHMPLPVVGTPEAHKGVCRAVGQNSGFSGGTSGKEPVCQCRSHKRHRLDPSREDHLEEGRAKHSSILHGESHGQRSLVGYSAWDCIELDTTEAIEHAPCPQGRPCPSRPHASHYRQ